MKWKFVATKRDPKPKTKLQEWREAIVFAVIVATLIRWGTVEAFVIPTPSMENSLLVGEYLFVSKIHYGPRTPRTPLQIPLTHQKIWGTEIPSYLTWIQLPSWRLPGISHVKREEVVVFNVPDKQMNDGVDRPIDLKTYYVKRCVGLPGDTLAKAERNLAVNGITLQYPSDMKFSHLITADDVIHPRNLKILGLDADDYYFLGRQNDGTTVYKMFLTSAQYDKVKASTFIRSIADDYTTDNGPDPDIFPMSKKKLWNGDNYGPLIIPYEGMTIEVNDSTLGIYGETIRLYEHQHAKMNGHKLEIDGRAVETYTFKQGYYFMMGDNRNNSLDSRYWGFVPEDHIVGKPLFIWFSIDKHADWLHKIRWSRLFTLVR